MTFVATPVKVLHMATTTGIELRLERTAARVKIVDIAQRMGVHRATVTRYEGLGLVPEDVAQKYRVALATFRDIASVA